MITMHGTLTMYACMPSGQVPAVVHKYGDLRVQLRHSCARGRLDRGLGAPGLDFSGGAARGVESGLV